MLSRGEGGPWVGGPAVISGASGFIGRHLLRLLLSEGREVVALARQPEMLADLSHPRLRVAPADLTNPSSYESHLLPGSSLFHLAAVRSHVGVSLRHIRRVNVEATLELMDRAAQAGVQRIVYLSTALVFGPSTHGPIDEQSPLSSTAGLCSAYVHSRVQALQAMGQLVEHGIPVVTLCPTIVYGPDHPSHPNRVTAHMRRLLRWRTHVDIGGGRQARNLVHVADVVEGISCAERLADQGDLLILGGEDVTLRQFSGLVLRCARLRPRMSVSIPAQPTLWAARWLDRLRRYSAPTGYEGRIVVLLHQWKYSCCRARTKLGYRARPLRVGIEQTLRSLGVAVS